MGNNSRRHSAKTTTTKRDGFGLGWRESAVGSGNTTAQMGGNSDDMRQDDGFDDFTTGAAAAAASSRRQSFPTSSTSDNNDFLTTTAAAAAVGGGNNTNDEDDDDDDMWFSQSSFSSLTRSHRNVDVSSPPSSSPSSSSSLFTHKLKQQQQQRRQPPNVMPVFNIFGQQDDGQEDDNDRNNDDDDTKKKKASSSSSTILVAMNPKWRADGTCTECREVITHTKKKHGPFHAFRRMEGLTVPGRVYKGYCLNCHHYDEILWKLGEDETTTTTAANTSAIMAQEQDNRSISSMLTQKRRNSNTTTKSRLPGVASSEKMDGGGGGGRRLKGVAAVGIQVGNEDEVGSAHSGNVDQAVNSALLKMHNIGIMIDDSSSISGTAAAQQQQQQQKRRQQQQQEDEDDMIKKSNRKGKSPLAREQKKRHGAYAVRYDDDSSTKDGSGRSLMLEDKKRKAMLLQGKDMIPEKKEEIGFCTFRAKACTLILCLCLFGLAIGLAVSITSKKCDEDDLSTVSGKGGDADRSNNGDEPTVSPIAWGWIQVGQELRIPSNIIPSFGYKVVLTAEGDRLAVSAPEDDSTHKRGGSVHVYQQILDESSDNNGGEQEGGEKWVDLGQPIPGEAMNDQAGWGLDLSDDGTRLAVGYPGNGNGFVRIFEYKKSTPDNEEAAISSRNNKDTKSTNVSTNSTDNSSSSSSTTNDKKDILGGVWIQIGQTLAGPDDTSRFGHTVALSTSGDVVAVGAPNSSEGPNGFQSGQVIMYAYNNVTDLWESHGQPLSGDAPFDWFGTGLDLSGNGKLVAIGAPGNDERGKDVGYVIVYSYDETMKAWKVMHGEIFGDYPGDGFGSVVAVAAYPEMFAAGARHADSKDYIDSGHVRIFFCDTNPAGWFHLGFDHDGRENNDQFGNTLSYSGDGRRWAAASRSKLDDGTDGGVGTVGSVRVYKYYAWDWEQIGEDLGGQPTGHRPWVGGGPSVSLSYDGWRVAVGYENIIANDSGEEAAVVRVFEWKVLPDQPAA